jgi:uncharacterized protein YbjT (DUF2867 family)
MKIVVIGGTGLIGSKTVAILRQGGHEVVAASPNTGVNSITGEGLKQAMAGAQVTKPRPRAHTRAYCSEDNVDRTENVLGSHFGATPVAGRHERRGWGDKTP